MYDLDPRIADRLARALHQHPEWIRTAELQVQIRAFQERFPSERLSRLQGEELLLDLHGRESKDCLVYWLEFKNDDAFRTRTFGSISGGAAFKFGMWQAAQDQRWYVRDGKVNRALQLSEAIAVAERHRDQLLAARRVVLDLPEDPTDDAFSQLPERIEAAAPEIHHLAFVHKYLFMQRPEVLDDFHSPDYQIHYLIELGQKPLGASLYQNAAPFVGAWHQFPRLGVPAALPRCRLVRREQDAAIRRIESGGEKTRERLDARCRGDPIPHRRAPCYAPTELVINGNDRTPETP